MPEERSIHTAVDVAHQIFGSSQSYAALPGDFVDRIREFGHLHFNVPDSPEADGLLFQFGRASWLAEPTFTLGVTRQFGQVDSRGEHESYLQVAIEFHYDLDSDLKLVAPRSSWWFRGADEDLSTWLESIEIDPIWEAISVKSIRELRITGDEV